MKAITEGEDIGDNRWRCLVQTASGWDRVAPGILCVFKDNRRPPRLPGFWNLTLPQKRDLWGIAKWGVWTSAAPCLAVSREIYLEGIELSKRTLLCQTKMCVQKIYSSQSNRRLESVWILHKMASHFTDLITVRVCYFCNHALKSSTIPSPS